MFHRAGARPTSRWRARCRAVAPRSKRRALHANLHRSPSAAEAGETSLLAAAREPMLQLRHLLAILLLLATLLLPATLLLLASLLRPLPHLLLRLLANLLLLLLLNLHANLNLLVGAAGRSIPTPTHG